MDYYKTLGVDRTASADEIKKAYRRMCAKHHPDKGGDEQDFKNIQEAYEGLTKKSSHQCGPNQWNFTSEDFNDINFGGFRFNFTHAVPPKNFDSRTSIQISLKDAFFGKDIQIRKSTGETIDFSIPKGIRDGAMIRIEGEGSRNQANLPPGDLFVEVRIKYPSNYRRNENDLFQIVEIGAIDAMIGEEIKIKHINEKEYKVKIPAGIQQGQHVKMSRLGMQTITQVVGDLYVVANIVVPKINDKESIKMLNKIKDKIQ